MNVQYDKILRNFVNVAIDNYKWTERDILKKFNLTTFNDEQLMVKFETFYQQFEDFCNINRGSNSGGNQTNINGKMWESDTCNKCNLHVQGFQQKKDGLHKKFTDHEIIYMEQSELKRYFKSNFGAVVHRKPDEAYFIKKSDGTYILKILEKKFQNVEGSVEDKLLTGPLIKREYELILEHFNITVSYAYCLSPFLAMKLRSNKPKYIIWNRIFIENNITVLFGADFDYYTKLDGWINNF